MPIPLDCDRQIDITDKICPLTFVHTRLAIDRMKAGMVLSILLKKGEPLENVPRSLEELGHTVLSLKPVDGSPDSYRLRVKVS